MQLNVPAGRAGLRQRDDRGVTLIELLVVIVLLGVIVFPLANALISFFQHANETNNRLSESHDAQIAAAYFAQDVASVGVHDWTAPGFPLVQSIAVDVGPTAGPFPCGAAGLNNAVVRLAWDDDTSSVTVVRVAYVLETVGDEQQLHRIKCVGSASPVSDIVLAHNVDSVDPPTCTDPATCTDAGVPQTVTLKLHLRARGSNDPILTVILTGQRRQS